MKHDILNTLGASTYRAGHFEEAIGHLNDAMKVLHQPLGQRTGVDASARGGGPSTPIASGEAMDWLILAMAHHRLGHAEEARRWLDKATAAIDGAPQAQPVGESLDSRIDWQTRLSYRVLRREAEGLIGGAGANRPKAAGADGAGRPAGAP